MLQLPMPGKRIKSLNIDPSRENQLDALHSFLIVCCDAELKALVDLVRSAAAERAAPIWIPNIGWPTWESAATT